MELPIRDWDFKGLRMIQLGGRSQRSIPRNHLGEGSSCKFVQKQKNVHEIKLQISDLRKLGMLAIPSSDVCKYIIENHFKIRQFSKDSTAYAYVYINTVTVFQPYILDCCK